MGITFRCPEPGCLQRLGVWFVNPIDGGHAYVSAPHADGTPWYLWQRSGEDFDTLTLSPSVDASKQGHWHGWIKNGEVT